MASTPKPPAKPARKSNADVVAQVFVDALADPELEKKEAEALAEREARMREALRAQGKLPAARKGG